MNVVPMVNKSLVVFQSTKDFSAAETLCREALDKDPQCDIAVATLAQLLLQQNKIKEALVMFEKGAEMARTEPELENHLTYALVSNLFCAASNAEHVYAGHKSSNRFC